MASNNNHKAIIFTGPSGGGKTTLSKYTLRQFAQVQRSISATTRSPRHGEIEGDDYHFISLEDFTNKIENNQFVEWEQVYEGLYYGTLEQEVKRVWEAGKVILFVVDVVGANSLKKYFGAQSINIFVKAPSMEVLSERLFHRGTESADEVKDRLEKARHELKYEEYADETIVNDSLEESKQQVQQLIKAYLEVDGVGKLVRDEE